MSRCLMVSPPHLPTAHLIVRTVLALVCFSVSISLLFYTLHKALCLLPPSHSQALSSQSLVFSVDHNRENSSSPALSPSHCLSLSRRSSHTALLRSQSLKIKEIKHRYRPVNFPDAKVRPSHFCTLLISSHSLFFSPPFCQRLENQC